MSDQSQIQAIPLLSYSPDNKKFLFSQEAESFLLNIHKPFGVLTVAGMYRTGKSYLLNKILLGKNGFNVGPTINPCTKGIWIWPEILKGNDEEGNEVDIILLDTEGFGAYDEDINHDTKIFTLAILLSSYFVYNSIGTIDEKTIQSLSFVVNMSKHIQIKSLSNVSSSMESDISLLFPKFSWVLRDFSLKLINPKGEKITSNEYLESILNYKNLLTVNDTTSKANTILENKNNIRNLIKTYFKDRTCFTLIRPVEDEKMLQNLQNLDDSELREEFLIQISELKKEIINKMRIKTFNSKKINGEIFVNIIKSYSSSINSGAVPNIENTWNSICRLESAKAYQNSEKEYDRLMKEYLKNLYEVNLKSSSEFESQSIYETEMNEVKFPSKEEFLLNTKIIESQCVDYLEKYSYGDCDEELKQRLRKRIREKFFFYEKLFEEEVKLSLNKYLQEKYNNIEKHIINLYNTKKQNEASTYFQVLLNEINTIVKSVELEVENKFSDFSGKYELILDFRNRTNSFFINDIFKKIINSMDILIKETNQLNTSNRNSFLEEISKINNQLQLKNKEIKSLNDENEEKNKKIKEIVNDFLKLKEEKTEIIKEKDMKIGYIKTLHDDYTKKIKDKEHIINILNEKIKGYEFKLNDEEVKGNLIKSQYTEDIHILNERIKELKEKEKEGISFYTERNKEIENENKNLKIAIEKVKEDYSNYQRKQKETSIESETQKKKYNIIIDSYKEKIDDYERKLDEVNKDNNKVIEGLNMKLKSEVGLYKTKVHQLELLLSQKESQIESESNENSNKIKNLNESINETKMKYEKYKNEAETLITQLKSQIEEEKNILSSTIKENEYKLKELEEKYKVLKKNESTETSKEIKEYYEKRIEDIMNDTKEKIDKMKEEIVDLKSRTVESTKNSNKIDIEKDFLIEELRQDKEDLENQMLKIRKEKILLNENLLRQEDQYKQEVERISNEKDYELDEQRRLIQKKLDEAQLDYERELKELKNLMRIEKEKNEDKLNEEKNNYIKMLYEEKISFENQLNQLERQKNDEFLRLNEIIDEKDENINELSMRVKKNDEEKVNNQKENEKNIIIINEQITEIEKLKDEIKSMENTLNEYNLKIQDLKNEVIQIKDENNLKNIKNDDLEKENQLLKMNISLLSTQFKEEKNNLLTKIDELNSVISEKNNSLMKSRFNNEKEEALLKQQLDYLSNRIEELNLIINTNQEKYEKTLCK